MAIIKVPAKLVEEIRYFQEEEVYDGVVEGICTAFGYVTDKMLTDLGGEAYNDSFACLLNFRNYRNLVDLLMKAEIIEE